MPSRRGVTLVELLIVVGIVAILLGLTLAGIQKVRNAAVIVQSKNNLRQIMLATHNFASANGSRIPSVQGAPHSANPGESVFGAILPYVEQQNLLKDVMASQGFIFIELFVSPADPTIAIGRTKPLASASYAANALVFANDGRLPESCPDGMSSTIAFAEHYGADCGGTSFFTFLTVGAPGWWHHPASFADMFDVRPVTQGNPPRSSASRSPSLTFQVAPSLKECDPSVAQTPHSSGMLIAFVDGSVNQLSPGMSDSTYWGLVTPSGREVLDGDW